MADVAAQLDDVLRGGEVDLAHLIAAPERFGELGRNAERASIGTLVQSDPKLPDGTPDDGAWQRLGIDPATTLGELDADRRAWMADLLRFWRRVPRDMIRTTSPADYMYERTPDQYFTAGPTTVRLVRVALLEQRKDEVASILDFGCGYGRILRAFKAAFPEAQLTACDLIPGAVDFCAETFGATGLYAADNPGETPLEGPFDLIWVGSLFTHLAASRWERLLDLFEKVVAPKGLLVFTTQGRFIRDQIATRAWHDAYDRPIWENWGATEAQLDTAVADYDTDGFAYIEWPALDRQYGTSVATPSWVMRQLETRPGLRVTGFKERGWGAQDVVVCVGTEGRQV